MIKIRLEAFSDGVLAIAIIVFEMRAPEHTGVAVWNQVHGHTSSAGRSYVGTGVTHR